MELLDRLVVFRPAKRRFAPCILLFCRPGVLLHPMPLLDLAQITLERNFAGISCPACSGRLEADTDKIGFWRRLVRGTKAHIRYRCRDCRKRYTLIQTGL